MRPPFGHPLRPGTTYAALLRTSVHDTDCNPFGQDDDFAAMLAGKPYNEADAGAESSMTAIMGRMAGYTGQEVTWEQAMQSQQKLMPDQLDWKMKLDFPPVAMPGVTKIS